MVLTLTLGQFILSSPLPDEDEPKAFVRNERQALAKRRQLLAQRLLGVKHSTDDTCDSQIFYNVEDIKNASLNVKSDCKIIDRSCIRKCKKVEELGEGCEFVDDKVCKIVKEEKCFEIEEEICLNECDEDDNKGSKFPNFPQSNLLEKIRPIIVEKVKTSGAQLSTLEDDDQIVNSVLLQLGPIIQQQIQAQLELEQTGQSVVSTGLNGGNRAQIATLFGSNTNSVSGGIGQSAFIEKSVLESGSAQLSVGSSKASSTNAGITNLITGTTQLTTDTGTVSQFSNGNDCEIVDDTVCGIVQEQKCEEKIIE